jgi:cytosine/adenosine deaminase-related metal-dependent hydrolase
MRKSISVKNIRYLVTCDDEDRLLENVNLLSEDGEITYIGEEEKAADVVIDAAGMILYPGLVNTHHHLFQTFSRNLPEVQNLELFGWLNHLLYKVWPKADADVVYHSAITGMGELLKYGCTTNFDHHYLYPEGTKELIDRQFEAADALGMRFTASRGSLSMGESLGGLPPDSIVQSVDEIMKDSVRLIETYHDPARFSMHQMVLAPCAPMNALADSYTESLALGRDKKVKLHTHLCETLDEERFCLEKFGLRPLAYMEKLGFVGPDVWYAHGIHFNDEELDVLASTGTGVAHCPISNMKLSSGIARIPEMLEKGVRVGLAVDGSASNDASNLLEELRVSYLLHRLGSSEKAPSGYDLLKVATRGSASLLGRDDIGYIAEHMAADFFLVDVNALEYIGTTYDPKSLPCTVGIKSPVAYTVVNGEILSDHGRLTKIDEAAFKEKADAVAAKFLGRM